MGPKKVSSSRAQSNPPRNEKNPPEKIMHGADKFIGALIVNTNLEIFLDLNNLGPDLLD